MSDRFQRGNNGGGGAGGGYQSQGYDDLQSRTLVVRNVDERATKDILFELFNQGGPVKKIVTQQGFYYVEFNEAESVGFCLSLFNGVKLFGRPLELEPKITYDPQNYFYIERLRSYPVEHAHHRWHKKDPRVMRESFTMNAKKLLNFGERQEQDSSRPSSGSSGSRSSSKKTKSNNKTRNDHRIVSESSRQMHHHHDHDHHGQNGHLSPNVTTDRRGIKRPHQNLQNQHHGHYQGRHSDPMPRAHHHQTHHYDRNYTPPRHHHHHHNHQQHGYYQDYHYQPNQQQYQNFSHQNRFEQSSSSSHPKYIPYGSSRNGGGGGATHYQGRSNRY